MRKFKGSRALAVQFSGSNGSSLDKLCRKNANIVWSPSSSILRYSSSAREEKRFLQVLFVREPSSHVELRMPHNSRRHFKGASRMKEPMAILSQNTKVAMYKRKLVDKEGKWLPSFPDTAATVET
jgi:23S rRNA C2498 (ribose-2'-O)-methylase RlmM